MHYVIKAQATGRRSSRGYCDDELGFDGGPLPTMSISWASAAGPLCSQPSMVGFQQGRERIELFSGLAPTVLCVSGRVGPGKPPYHSRHYPGPPPTQANRKETPKENSELKKKEVRQAHSHLCTVSKGKRHSACSRHPGDRS